MIEVSGKLLLGWPEAAQKHFAVNIPAQLEWPPEQIQRAFAEVWYGYIDSGPEHVVFVSAAYKNQTGEETQLDKPVK